MSELKPCPFCGGEAELRESSRWPRYGRNQGKKVYGYSVVCVNAHCIIFLADNKYWLKRQAAIDAWNRREPSQPDKREGE